MPRKGEAQSAPQPVPDVPLAVFVRPCGRFVMLVGVRQVVQWRNFIPGSRVLITAKCPRQKSDELIERPGSRLRFWYREAGAGPLVRSDGVLDAKASGMVLLCESGPMNGLISRHILPLVCMQGWLDLFAVQDYRGFDSAHYLASVVDSPWNRVVMAAHMDAVDEQMRMDKVQQQSEAVA